MNFFPGQRWISNTESELGLGIISALTPRQVTLLFPASNEHRIYSVSKPPVTRVIFSAGDTITSQQGWQLLIDAVNEYNHLITYSGTRTDTQQPVSLREDLLDGALIFSRPQDKLFAGYTEPMNHFLLRYHARLHQSKQYSLPWSGLRGTRTSLIPHQLHIAHEVSKRHAPRVLLADEVGLGKTIEAGMIIHQRVLSGSASRVLIVVPDALQHQWLVEMLRRFNLHFALFDDERYAAVLHENANPFDSEQLVICSLDFLCASPQRLELLCFANWDLLVVDEAHHLVWSEAQPGHEYRCVEQLAQQVPGVLLLTATPEQLGIESHFARLQLLDNNRFHNLAQFLAEQQQYRPLADAVALLLRDQPLDRQQIDHLQALVSEQDISDLLRHASDSSANDSSERFSARRELIALLLDRHGTGRVLFRNTRHEVAGFPHRVFHSIKLPLPSQYQTMLREHASAQASQSVEQRVNAMLCPEQLYQSQQGTDNWCDVDPRVSWLINYLLQHRQQKVLIICALASTALSLEQALREKEGIRAGVFHEAMSIIERDRAAAWFADQETGAQVLLCSEIGSEGRNFQFASTLIMFDLPLNPDLLEQRIGRLDRIGQQRDVQIYVPYMTDSVQARLVRWYHEGLDAFEHTNATGRTIFERLYSRLAPCLVAGTLDDEFAQLLADCREQNRALKQQLEQGRDRLLELNSSGGEQAKQLAGIIAQQDNDPALVDFCNTLFDIVGVNCEELDDRLVALTPHSTMLIPDFPGLGQSSTVTFNREMALAREDVQFLSWEHPIIRNGLDLILSTDLGICSVALLKFPELPAGTLLLELLYVVESNAPKTLQLQRFLPPTPFRLLLDQRGNNLAENIDFQRLQKRLKAINRHTASKLVHILQKEIKSILQLGDLPAGQLAQDIINSAHQTASQTLDSEISRLQALKTINPSIRDDELHALLHNREQVLDSLQQARWRLDALRLIVVSD